MVKSALGFWGYGIAHPGGLFHHEDTKDTKDGSSWSSNMTAEELSHVATGAAIEVHRHLGPGLLESAYEASFSFELANRGIQHERQKAVPLVYKGMRLDCGYRLDVLVDREVIVELKSVKALAPIDSARMLSYLRLTGCSLGLIINFNVPILKDGIRRIINTFHNPSRPRGDSTM